MMLDIQKLYEAPISPHYWDAVNKAYHYYDKIAKAFSQAFLEDFLQAHAELSKMERDESYRQGFQEGVAVMTRSFLSLPGSPKTLSP